MRHTAIFLSFVASAMSAAVTTTLKPYLPIGKVGWQGLVVPGGPTIEVWGESFEDIEAKIQKDYPDFSIYVAQEPVTPETSADPALAARKVLETRQRDVNCDPRYGEAELDAAVEAKDYLRRIAGNSCKARARTCIRTQRVRDAAIGICNDNTWDIDIQCTQIADWTLVIFQNCHTSRWGCDRRGCDISYTTTQGLVFSPQKSWNVIVGWCGFFGNPERPVKARTIEAEV